MMRLAIIIGLSAMLVLLTSCASMVDRAAETLVLRSDNRPATYAITETTDAFTTADGIQLAADIYHPDGLQKTPTILVRIPFSDQFSNRLRSAIIARYWAGRGYTVVVQGTRGRYRSGGSFYPLMHERVDGIATIHWLAKQPWFDGRLAMWGGSAFGYTQWVLADQASPGPRAFFIQIASSNFYQMFYSGGAFSLESALYWAIRSRGSEDRDVTMEDLDRGANHLPLIEADNVTIGDTDFFNDWVLNRDTTAYWQKIDGVDRNRNVQAPVLLMAGWFDPFLPSQLNDFAAITTHANPSVVKETRLIIGPWKHADAVPLPGSGEEIPYRSASVALSIPWFDHQLGVTATPLAMPKVRIFVMGENRWRNEQEWPLARTQYTPFYLSSGGHANTLHGDGMLQGRPHSVAATDAFVYDPADPVPTAGGAMLTERAGTEKQNAIEARADVLVYTTPVLSDDMEVTGPVKALLHVSTDAPLTDFTAKLLDVHPDGAAYNLSDGIVRQHYQAGKPTKIEINLWPTSNLFLKGHQIRLEISSSNFPRYDRNPNTGAFIPTAIKMSSARQTVHHSKQYPSYLILPVIPRDHGAP